VNHDNGYKLLFSHAEMVEDLLRGFVKGSWVKQLDFSTLEKVGGGYVSDDLRHRESDVVWRVRWRKKRWLYIYILLEFQSTVDPFMAVRVMTYVGLLYQDLIRRKLLTPGGKLPPVLPLVLYNGHTAWSAAQDVADLVEAVPGGLEQYRPQLRYCLLDEGRIAETGLESLRNLAAALFRLEKSRSPEDVQQVLAALGEWLKEPQHAELQRAFTVWLVQVLLPARMPGAVIPAIVDLQEVKSMLAERVIEWTREWKQEGYQEGRQEGRQEGIERSLTALRGVLLRRLEGRFGPLPKTIAEQVEAVASLEKMGELLAESAVVPSLAALGLTARAKKRPAGKAKRG
jgi:predicted transposase/invertase (TIGR01784 family)